MLLLLRLAACVATNMWNCMDLIVVALGVTCLCYRFFMIIDVLFMCLSRCLEVINLMQDFMDSPEIVILEQLLLSQEDCILTPEYFLLAYWELSWLLYELHLLEHGSEQTDSIIGLLAKVATNVYNLRNFANYVCNVYAVVVVAVVLLSYVYLYLTGCGGWGCSRAVSSGSLDYRDTYIAIVLFRGAYVWIKFRDVLLNVFPKEHYDE